MSSVWVSRPATRTAATPIASRRTTVRLRVSSVLDDSRVEAGTERSSPLLCAAVVRVGSGNVNASDCLGAVDRKSAVAVALLEPLLVERLLAEPLPVERLLAEPLLAELLALDPLPEPLAPVIP